MAKGDSKKREYGELPTGNGGSSNNASSGGASDLLGLFPPPIPKGNIFANNPTFSDSTNIASGNGEGDGDGSESFLKIAAASSLRLEAQAQGPPVRKSVTAAIRSLLSPFASPSTWLGGILFVLYHVVFCMANGGSITRPYSGTNNLGDMARYTALGIILSCPFLVFALSDKAATIGTGKRIGIPAMYPSADLFLAPFLAETASIIDKTIMDDWNSGGLVNHTPYDDEKFLTEKWFGSFALVVSFGMFAAGSLLVLASKIKLANLGTYLPYSVLCGFFSSVGIIMWKLAIAIDTPSTTSILTAEDSQYHYWAVLLLHHLPSLVMGIAMNRLGSKHPFYVPGLILLTILSFYGVMLVLGVSLEEAQTNGWFYEDEELRSSSSITSSSLSLNDNEEGSVDDGSVSWLDHYWLPPHPFGTWVAVGVRCVHWKAVFKGAENMVALAIIYLLRTSIHAAALKKNIHNLIRRVPVESTTNDNCNNDEDGTPIIPTLTTPKLLDIEKISNPGGGLVVSPPKLNSNSKPKRHRRDASLTSVGLRMASQLAQSVQNEVRIVNLSLADGQSLGGKHHCRKTSVLSSSNATTAMRRNIGKNKSNSIINNNNHHQPQRDSKISNLAFPPPSQSPLIPSNESDEGTLLLPTLQRAVSGLTQRGEFSIVSYDEKHKSFDEAATNIGGRTGGNHPTAEENVDYVETHAPATDLTLEEIFVQYGYGLFVTGACGGFGCCPTIATSNTMYAIGAGKPFPQYFSVVLLVAFYSSGFEIVRYIPKAAFSSLLVLSAADNIVTWFIKPISKMDNLLEWSVVPLIVMFTLLVGMLQAVVLGIGVSTFLFVTDFFRVGVVKYRASGAEIRSRIERSLVESVWLDTHGDNLQVLVLQNYLFFGNAQSVLGFIETMFEEIPLAESIRLAGPLPPIPVVLVLDLSLITGMDTSTVEVFMDIWRICKTSDCKLYLCGLSPRLKKTFAKGGMKPITKGARKSRTLMYFSDLDHGLGRAEEVLIDTKMGDFANQCLFRLKTGSSGFHKALQHIDQLHSTDMADGLLALEPHTGVVTLEEGQILYERDGGMIQEKDHGLFFIESGMIREDDGRSNRTNTRTGGSFRGSILAKENDNTLRGRHARLDTAAQRGAWTKRPGRETDFHQTNNLRISTAGPGWILGANALAIGQNSLKKFKAITKVKMHHLRFSDLTKIEEDNPALVLRLYKMLTHVMARKEEDTVSHLSTLHDILSSKPTSR